MATRGVTSWYVSRRVPVPYEDATRALGEALRSGAVGPPTVPDVTVTDVHHSRPGAARGFEGRLRLGAAFAAHRIDVELVPWSGSESALGVRPARRPPRLRADRYFERAIGLLDGLEGALLAGAAAPDRTEMRRAS